MARSFEQRQYIEMQDLDEDDDQDLEYCVKLLKWIPGGCKVKECKDIDDCPYLDKLVGIK